MLDLSTVTIKPTPTQRIMWWMRQNIDEAWHAESFCTHIIAPTPHQGIRSIEKVNPSYVQREHYDVWERYWKVLKNTKLGFVVMNHIWPIYASKDFFANQNPLSVEYWERRKKKAIKRKERANQFNHNVLDMVDFEVYGDAKDKYGYTELDPIKVITAMVQAGFKVDIRFPYSDHREIYSLGCRFVGEELMGTKYSPHYGPAKTDSSIYQIIVVPNGHPNKYKRFTVAQAVTEIAKGKDLMIFPNGDCTQVAKELAEAMSKVAPTKPDADIKGEPGLANPDPVTPDSLLKIVA